jgi:hypothetical protein
LVPLRFFRRRIQHEQTTYETRLVGTTEDYAKVNRLQMAAGRFLEDNEDQPDKADDERLRKVAVLGARAAAELFPSKQLKHVVGQTVILNKEDYKVVGVIKQRSSQETDGQAADFNKDVYIPIAACRAFGNGKRTEEQVEFDQVIIAVSGIEQVQPAADAIREMLKQHHNKQDWEATERYERGR